MFIVNRVFSWMHFLYALLTPSFEKHDLLLVFICLRKDLWGYVVAVCSYSTILPRFFVFVYFSFAQKNQWASHLTIIGIKIIQNMITKKICKEVNKMKDNISKIFMTDRLDFWFFAEKFYNGSECLTSSQMSRPIQITTHYTWSTWNNWMK